jgi:hypothetical protein
MIAPRELLDTSIAQLCTLVRFLGEQISEGRGGAEPATAETRACHEILRSVSEIILKLQAAGHGRTGNIDLPAIVDRNGDPRSRQPADQRLMASSSSGKNLESQWLSAVRSPAPHPGSSGRVGVAPPFPVRRRRKLKRLSERPQASPSIP